MNNLKLLLKYTLINSLGINKLQKKKDGNARTIGLGSLLLVVYLAILAFITFYMFMFTSLYEMEGKTEEIYLFILAVTSIVCFFTTISKANVYIFRTKDFDFLMSLPIKPSTIIASKLLSLYLYNLFFVFSLIIGVDIAYTFIAGFNVVIILLSLVAIILIPLFPMAISSFIAFLLGFIPLSQKTKNIIATILYVLLFAVFFVAYFLAMSGVEGNITIIYSTIGRYYFLSNWFYSGMIEGNILNLLLFVGVSVASSIIFIAIISSCFLKVNGMMSRSQTNTNFKLTEEKYNRQGAVKTIFSREIRSLINYPAVLIQLATGPILSVILTIMMSLTYFKEIVTSDTESIIKLPNAFLVIIGISIIFSLTMVATTSSSISLEGKSFWILKSAPVKTLDVFKAKCLVNIAFTIPCGIIDVILATVLLKADVLLAIVVLIMVILYVLFATFTGLLLNISSPKFDYDNPVKAVKQGKPVLIMMLIDIVVILVAGGSMLLGAIIGGAYLASILGTLLGAVLMAISIYLLTTLGVRKYDAISA